MWKPLRSHAQNIHHYASTILLVLLALALSMFEGIAWALLLLAAAVISFLSTRSLLNDIARSNVQKKHLDQQLIQSQKLASIGELSSGIAHEINNPLAIIGQEIEWVRHLLTGEEVRQLMHYEELADSCREIAHQVDRCKEITHKLLDFARKKEPLIQSVDMNRLIEDMARLVDREASQKGIQIVREYQQELPLVHTDPPLMRQVILNLLTNASHAVGKDGSITVVTRKSGDNSVDVKVSDTGCGIPQEHISKIFDPFFTTKPQGKGTGLGLSICHGIITRLGGQINVVSEEGQGATFTVRLPIESRKGVQ